MGMKFCLDKREFPCRCHQRLPPPRAAGAEAAPVLIPSRGVCVCVHIPHKAAALCRGLSEETLAGEAAHADSGLRISEGVT